jgi:hypothetical protein
VAVALRRRAVVVVVAALVFGGCSSPLPQPPRSAHADADFIEVASKPPPPRPEEVPEQSEPRAVWLDGEWGWTDRRWLWRRGGWLIVPRDATFAPWAVRVDSDGGVHFAPGTWRSGHGEVIEAPALLARSRVARDAGSREGSP